MGFLQTAYGPPENKVQVVGSCAVLRNVFRNARLRPQPLILMQHCYYPSRKIFKKKNDTPDKVRAFQENKKKMSQGTLSSRAAQGLCKTAFTNSKRVLLPYLGPFSEFHGCGFSDVVWPLLRDSIGLGGYGRKRNVKKSWLFERQNLSEVGLLDLMLRSLILPSYQFESRAPLFYSFC